MAIRNQIWFFRFYPIFYSIFIRFLPIFRLFSTFRLSDTTALIKTPINSEQRASHTAWTPPSTDSIVLLGGSSDATRLTAIEIPPGFSTGGRNFALNHSAWGACGIPDGETIVMIGGFNPTHNYVTRWMCKCSFTSPTSIVVLIWTFYFLLQISGQPIRK